jgi:hypothetical protein
MSVISDKVRTHDSLGRRFRDATHSTGKRVTLQEADLKWFKMIHRLGHQPGVNLFEETKDVRKNYTRALHRMRDLRHESNSVYGGRTLSYPLAQDATRRPDRNYTVYGLTAKAIELLKERGLYRENAPRTNHSQWKHDFFGASIATSIYFASMQAGCQFLYHDEIVDQLHTTTFEVSYFYSQTRYSALIRPDGFCGVRYPNGEERIFIREEDCGTERIASDNRGVKSHKHTALAYIALLADRDTKARFLPFNRVVVLNSFSHTTKMKSAMKVVEDVTGGKGTNFMLYKSWETFGDRFRPPAFEPRIFTEPWLRAAQAPFDISRV